MLSNHNSSVEKANNNLIREHAAGVIQRAIRLRAVAIAKNTNALMRANARLEGRVRELEVERHSLACEKRRLRVMCAEYVAIGVLFQLQTEKQRAEIDRLGKARRARRKKHLFY